MNDKLHAALLPEYGPAAAALKEAAPLLYQALARRLSTPSASLADLVVLVVEDGIRLATRGECRAILQRSPAMAPVCALLADPPLAEHAYVLCLTHGEAPVVYQMPIERAQLTVKRPPTVAQEQLLDALVSTAAPQILTTMAEHLKQHPGYRKNPVALAAFLHDTGPGIIPVERLRQILMSHGFHSDAQALEQAPRPQHIWIWVSTWHEGGTAGLRQLCVSPASLERTLAGAAILH
jgi:hypothetical protein